MAALTPGDAAAMDDDPLPQLWDLASSVREDEDQAELAQELALAEAAALTLSDRLAGGVGDQVAVATTTGDEVRGILVAVAADGLVVADERGDTVLRFDEVAGVATPGLRPGPAQRRRLSVVSHLRDWVPGPVVVGRAGATLLTGTLRAVGGDHLVVEPPTDRARTAGWGPRPARRWSVLVPLTAVAWVRRA